jgi:hypothetical protein
MMIFRMSAEPAEFAGGGVKMWRENGCAGEKPGKASPEHMLPGEEKDYML